MAAVVWMAALLMSVCFDGLGRRYIPFVPAVTFFVLKDAVLLGGWLYFRPAPSLRRHAIAQLGSLRWAGAAALLFTALEVLSPELPSVALGLVGMRGYWLWWLAPIVVGDACRDPRVRRGALLVLSAVAVVVAVFGIIQFRSPAAIETGYVNSEGLMIGPHALGSEHVRVPATFSYITGFGDFVIVAPIVLIAFALEDRSRFHRSALLASAVIVLGAAPTNGSRTPLVWFALSVMVIGVEARILFSPRGRVFVGVAVVAALATMFLVPEAFQGVEERWNQTEETSSRFVTALSALPLVPLNIDFSPLGLGTGALQPAREAWTMVPPKYIAEMEWERVVIEQGLIGYLLVYAFRVSIAVALVRMRKTFKKAGKTALSGLCVALAAISIGQSLVFDHVMQALFAIALGIVFGQYLELKQDPASAQRLTRPT